MRTVSKATLSGTIRKDSAVLIELEGGELKFRNVEQD